jgi:serine/threonine-protein kinase
MSVEPAEPSRLPWTIAATCALAALALGAMLWAPWQSTPEPPTVVRFQIQQPENLTFMPNFAISPDGSKLAYQAVGTDGVQREWLRPMDALESHPLPGMEVPLPVPIFWFPDSRFLFCSIGGKLKKVNVAGGPPVSVCDVPAIVVGGSVNRDGVVVFALNNGGAIQRVSSSGARHRP